LLENGVSLIDPTCKLARLLQFFIGRLPGPIPSRSGEVGGWGEEQGSACKKGPFDEIPARGSHAEGSFIVREVLRVLEIIVVKCPEVVKAVFGQK
jgi:hypothetical protein